LFTVTNTFIVYFDQHVNTKQIPSVQLHGQKSVSSWSIS